MKNATKQHFEYIRNQAKNIFQDYRSTWCDLLRWAMPWKSTWILSQTPGERKNQHIFDPTHSLALRSSVAGFMEGNTSTTRPWIRIGVSDGEPTDTERAWLLHFTQRVLSVINRSNFYHASGNFYYDYHTVNTGAQYFQEKDDGSFFVHSLIPGSYYVINDQYGEAETLVREFSLNVKSLVDRYGKLNSDGSRNWSNFSSSIKKMWEEANYTQAIDLCHIVMKNPEYDIENPDDPFNREWLEVTYEIGGPSSNNYGNGVEFGLDTERMFDETYLERITTKRKRFVVGKTTQGSEYGEEGPMLMSLGLVKSLNKKAVSQDAAIEQILHPTLQGPASLRKSYISTTPNTFIPIDSRSSANKGKLESVYQINPGIAALTQNVGDMRQMVDKIFYSDFLTYLSRNPKTRTATETSAIVEEQQRVIGPVLQSLNQTYNKPFVEFAMDYTLFEDPYLDPPPESLAGRALKPEFVSVFAQAQRAADLPAINQFVAMVTQVANIDPKILQKVNTDKLADLYEDRLYIPTGLNNPQDKVDAMREQAAMQAQRQQALQETLPAMARAAKDASQVQQSQE